MKKQIKVLIVDDSPIMQEYLNSIIADDLGMIVVGTAANGEEAVRLTQKLKPDVISMDVHMPVMGGLDAVREIMRVQPTPIVVVSGSLDNAELNLAFSATRAGALAVIPKPPAPMHPNFLAARDELLSTLRSMSEVAVIHHWGKQNVDQPVNRLSPIPSEAEIQYAVIGIAASTGGPSALVDILSQLPANFPVPIVIVQHISEGFEGGLVQWLDRSCLLKVGIARQGQRLEPGQVVIAPSGLHLRFRPDGSIHLDHQRGNYLNVPSADIMFQSMAQYFGRYAIGVILTGMGSDGAVGLRAMRDTGAITIAQDQASCIVYGMPKEAMALNGVDYVVNLKKIARVITGLTLRQPIRNLL